jgi:hypothetical protein
VELLKTHSRLVLLEKFEHLNHNESPADVSPHVGAIIFGKFEKSAQEVVNVLGYYSASAVNEMIDAVYRLRTNFRILKATVSKKSLKKMSHCLYVPFGTYLNKIVKNALHLFCVKLVLAILAEFHKRRKSSVNTLVSTRIEHLV